MAFKAYTYGDTQPAQHGDDDVYKFLDNGVLAIHFADTAKGTAYYAPHKWDLIDADTDHRPGRTKGGDEVWAFRE
jgi:hypothetical protein